MTNQRVPILAVVFRGIAVVALGGLVYALLILGFPEAIEITVQRDRPSSGEWGGVEVLFGLTGSALGWFGPIWIQRKWEGSIIVLCVIATVLSLGSLSAAIAGLIVARETLPVGILEMGLCAVGGRAVGIGAWVMREHYT